MRRAATELSVEEFISMAYPSGEQDEAIAAAALDVLTLSKALTSREHLLALLLATNPEWCKAFLFPDEEAMVDSARAKAPAALVVHAQGAIMWKECRDYLEKTGALIVDRSSSTQKLRPGAELVSVREGLPQGTDGIAQLALKALETLQEVETGHRTPSFVQGGIMQFLRDKCDEQMGVV